MTSEAARPAGSDGWIGSWSPGLGDPSVMGWVTVVLYFVAAWQCLTLARGKAVVLVRREAVLWWIIFGALLALGINKQLDLQSALTEAGRLLARQEGWYEQRAELQKAFVLQVALLGLIAAGLLAWVARRTPMATRAAVAGLAILTAFVTIRASSFHHVDLFIHSSWFGVQINWVLEIGGILVIILAARFRLHRRSSARGGSSARAK